MKLDTGNRSFVLLLSLATALYLFLSAAACALLSLLLYRLATDGAGAFEGSAWVLAPAGLFLGLFAAAGVLGVRSLGNQIASSRRLARRVAGVGSQPPADTAEIAATSGLRRGLRVIDATEPFSFTYGAFFPQVVISRGLLDSADRDELEAVLVHERYHVRNLDPLKVVLARALARAFFFVPALRELERRYLAGRELAADRRALSSCGRRPLASALMKVVRGPAWPELSTAAAIGGPDLLDMRVAQLEAGGEPALGALPRRSLLLSGAGLGLVVLSLSGALAGLGGLTAAMQLSNGEMDGGAAGVAMIVGCATPWAVAGWLLWRWLRA
jgi:Zn-dependent protease with chaperone function